MRDIETVEAFDQAIAGPDLVIAEFYADWCPDCQRIKPFMPEVANAFSDKLTVIRVDRETLPELFARYDVFGIPSFIAFRNGRELIRFVSRDPKTREEIEHFFRRAVEVAESLDGE